MDQKRTFHVLLHHPLAFLDKSWIAIHQPENLIQILDTFNTWKADTPVSQDFARHYVNCLIMSGISPLPLDFAPGLMIQMLFMPSMSSCGLTCASLCSIALQHTKRSLSSISAPSLRMKTDVAILWDTVKHFGFLLPHVKLIHCTHWTTR